tara:strand:- start:89 stop:337 length:249 start_codon:yes stop_codon:yes gene_type:complete
MPFIEQPFTNWRAQIAFKAVDEDVPGEQNADLLRHSAEPLISTLDTHPACFLGATDPVLAYPAKLGTLLEMIHRAQTSIVFE